MFSEARARGLPDVRCARARRPRDVCKPRDPKGGSHKAALCDPPSRATPAGGRSDEYGETNELQITESSGGQTTPDQQLERLVPRQYREFFPGKDFCADGHFYLHDGTAWSFYRGDLLDE